MGALASVGVDNDFAACQTGIAVRTADDKLTRWVDEILDVVVEQSQHFLAVYLGFHTGDEDMDDIVLDAGQHLLVIGVELVVLSAHHDGVDALGNALVAVLNGHLALRVGTQIGHLLTLLADVGQCAHEQMRQVERHRHIVLGLVGGITEHHALVASALVLVLFTVHTTADVTALLVNGSENTARVAVELIFALRITDTIDGTAGNGLQVNISLRAHLAHDHHLSGSDKGLDGAACLIVVSQKLVYQCVGNLVGYFVGMTLRHRF